jgi:hypothetical protein
MSEDRSGLLRTSLRPTLSIPLGTAAGSPTRGYVASRNFEHLLLVVFRGELARHYTGRASGNL